MSEKPNVLFVCTGNSCRSQMAEGWLRQLGADRFGTYSAGTSPVEATHPLAVKVMSEVGIDISQQRPKGLKEYLCKLPIRHMVVVCDGAKESCPRIWPGVLHRHYWPFSDPAKLTGSEDVVIAGFREVRDKIRARLEVWLADPDGVNDEIP